MEVSRGIAMEKKSSDSDPQGQDNAQKVTTAKEGEKEPRIMDADNVISPQARAIPCRARRMTADHNVLVSTHIEDEESS